MPPPGRPLWSDAFQQLHVREPQEPLRARQLDDDVQPDQTEDDEQEEEVPRVSETRQRYRAQQRHCHIRTHRLPYEVTMSSSPCDDGVSGPTSKHNNRNGG